MTPVMMYKFVAAQKFYYNSIHKYLDIPISKT